MNRSLFLKNIIEDAGKLARNYFGQYQSLAREVKDSAQDVVTVADREVEKFIVASLQEEFPTDGILGEETGLYNEGGSIWVIDPIDGTANFARGIAYYSISIAYISADAIKLGAVYDPTLDELFYAEQGRGAYLNGSKIQAGSDSWGSAIIGLGRSERYAAQEYWQNIPRILGSGAEYRRLGSAALSMAHVAAGRLSAYYEPHLHPWDALGGLLLAHEAGAVTNISSYMAGDWQQGAPIVASSKSITTRFNQILAEDKN